MDIKVQQQMWLVLLQGINKDKRPTKEEMMKTQEDSPSMEELTNSPTDTNHNEVNVLFLINQERALFVNDTHQIYVSNLILNLKFIKSIFFSAQLN